MRLHDMHLYDFLFGLRITNWHGQTVAPVLPESILGHGPSVFQHSLHALGHARDQALWRRVAPRNPQQLPAERREGVRLLLLSPQRLLRPAPHVLLRVHIRRILRPTRHGADQDALWRHNATRVFARSPTGRLSLSLTATGSSNPGVRPEDLRAQTFYVTLPPRTLRSSKRKKASFCKA